MAKERNCDHCNNSFPMERTVCPHCGRTSYFPNVDAAEDPDETKALERRYQQASREAQSRDCEDILLEFEIAADRSKTVIARNLEQTQTLATSDKSLYATFYQLAETGRIPEPDKWNIIRRVVDEALFPGFKEEVRFGALTLDGLGLSNYGEFFLILREDLTSYRATVFEENSVIFMEHHDIRIADSDNLPKSYRAKWEKRGRVCVAKLAGKIDKNTRPKEFAEILLKQGTKPEDDEFVEVHVWGPFEQLKKSSTPDVARVGARPF